MRRKQAVAQGTGHLPGVQYWTQDKFLQLVPDEAAA